MEKIPPPLLGLTCAALQWLLQIHLPLAVLESPAVFWAGWAIVAVGVALSGSSLGIFACARTTIVPHGKPSALVSCGAYRFTRNPMYLGGFVVLVGFAAVVGAASAFALPFVFAGVLNAFHIPFEEKMLESRFGDDYRDYQRRVRRWI